MTVAALYVDPHGVYAGLPDVDVWDESRDARRYPGQHPVVAHPPCARWCRLAELVQSRGGKSVGDDDGTFASALASVRRWGGVLEHPAWSKAWPAYGLLRPTEFGWSRDLDGGWTCEVFQSAYGHRAPKATWLYYFGKSAPKVLIWKRPQTEMTVSTSRARTRGIELPKRERAATPPAFRDALLAIARASAYAEASFAT